MIFMPESPRYLMHKRKPLEAFKVWKRIRGVEKWDAREEFFIMKISVEEEQRIVAESAVNKRFPFLDFFTYVLFCFLFPAPTSRQLD